MDVLAGAFMLLRRAALDKVGLLDETFFMYGEDIDLSYRIVKGGYKNYYYPDTTIIHYKGESKQNHSIRPANGFPAQEDPSPSPPLPESEFCGCPITASSPS